ncbi:MAG: hypothetical protein ABIM88_07985 [candidate division WOR-3 bacterium]
MALKPPKYVRTVRELIYGLYAEGFRGNYDFVVSRFKKLKSGEISRDWQKELEKGKICAYCGTDKNLTLDHIIPISRAIGVMDIYDPGVVITYKKGKK